MPPEIFSFLQTQVNTQLQQFLPGIMPQENNGSAPGIFDAIISEYILTEDSAALQPEITAQPMNIAQPRNTAQSVNTAQPVNIAQNMPESSQPITLGNNAIISGRMTDILSGGNSEADSAQGGNERSDITQGENVRDENFQADIAQSDNKRVDSSQVNSSRVNNVQVNNVQVNNVQVDSSQVSNAQVNNARVNIAQVSSPTPEVKPTVTENFSSWQNLFADVRRSETHFRRHESFAPQSDFDDGIVIASETLDDEIIAAPEVVDDGIIPASEVVDDGIIPEAPEVVDDAKFNADGEIPDTLPPNVPAKNYIHEESANLNPEITDEVMPKNVAPNPEVAEREVTAHDKVSPRIETPVISEEVLPENDRPTPEVTEHDETSARIATPVITDTEIQAPKAPAHNVQNDDVPDSRVPLQPVITEEVLPENEPQPEPEETPITPEIPAKFPERRNTQKSPAITAREPETLDAPEAREIPEEIDAPQNTHRVTPDSRAEIDSPNEITNPENQSPTQVSHSQNDYGREISEPLTRENPEITPDDETPETQPEEHPKAHPEITGDNLIMAGFAPVQTELNRPEVSAPEITDTPKTSRTQPQSPRKFQAVTHSMTDPDSDSLNDPQTVAPESPRNVQPRDIQPENGHEGIIETETTQPSEPQSPGGISPQRVTTAAPSRTSQRTDSRSEPRTDTRRTEALNDFQAFFDSAVRTRRSTARVSTQPLSLRTGTYEAAETQSQSRTLRNGIVNVVRFIRTDGVRKANIIVDPPALGRISVELTSSSSGVEASVKVANEQIRQIVQDQFTQLRDNLLQQGVQVSEFTVDVQQDNSRQGQNSGGQNNRDNYTFTASENDDDTETFRADLEEGLLYWIA